MKWGKAVENEKEKEKKREIVKIVGRVWGEDRVGGWVYGLSMEAEYRMSVDERGWGWKGGKGVTTLLEVGQTHQL